MYKRQGKYFAIYDDTLRNQLLREQAITDSMESALSQNQFLVYLQPKYRIKDEVLVGAEALVRWNHPVWGFLSPAEFIPLFEKNGFITRLDRFVWEKACAVLHDWDERGYYPMSVSVNVSRADIYNEEDVYKRQKGDCTLWFPDSSHGRIPGPVRHGFMRQAVSGL